MALSKHLKYEHNIHTKKERQQYYNTYLLTNYDELKCSYCGKEVKFKSISKGYVSHCNTTCGTLDVKVKEKYKQTMLKKYGVEHNFNIPIDGSMRACDKTKIKKYGTLFSKEQIEKSKQTMLKRYGVEHNFNTPIDGSMRTCDKTKMKKYGGIFMDSKIIKEKITKTVVEKYGVDNVRKSKIIKDKIKQTKLDRYGDENYNNRDKARKTCLKLYGATNPSLNCGYDHTRKYILKNGNSVT